MKKLILTLFSLALVIVLNSNVHAQTSASADVTASAQIVNDISISTTNNLNFGQLQGDFSDTPTIDFIDGNSNTGTGDNVQEGLAEVTASPNVDFNVTVTAPANLTNTASGSSATIPFIGHFYGDQDNNNGTTTDNTSLTSGTSTNVTTNDNTTGTNYYLHVGGELTPNSGSEYTGGTYEGTVTVSVDYTSSS